MNSVNIENRQPRAKGELMKNCIDCGVPFTPRGKNHKRCDVCANKARLKNMNDWYYAHKLPGPGSGGKLGHENQNYRHGICVFRRWAKEKLKQLNNCCERCGNYIDDSIRGTWAGHHKDHNRQNNVKENLEILCKRCHQVEHECWRAFQSVETTPKGSTQETVEARGPSLDGDDIVRSAWEHAANK